MANFTANISAKLDTSGIESQLKSIENKYAITLNVKELEANGATKQIESLGATSAKAFTASFNNSLNGSKNGGINLSGIKGALSSLKFDRSEIAQITKDLENLNLVSGKIQRSNGAEGISLKITGLDKDGNTVSSLRRIDAETQSIKESSRSTAHAFSDSIGQMRNELSSGKIDSEISKITAQYHKLGADGKVNLAEVEEKLISLRAAQADMASAGADTTKFVSSYMSYSSTLDGLKQGLSTIGDTQKAYESLLKVSSQIGNVKFNLDKLDGSGELVEVGKLQEELRELEEIYRSIASTSGVSFSDEQKANLDKAQAQKSNDYVMKIKSEVDSNSLSKSLSAVRASYQGVANTGHEKLGEIQSGIAQLETLSNTISTSSNPTEVISSYERYNQTLLRVKNTLTTVSNSNKEFASSFKVNTLESKIEIWLNNNTRASAEAKAAMQAYLTTLRKAKADGQVTVGMLNSIEQGVKETDAAMTAAGRKGKSFFSQFSGTFKDVSKYISASQIFRRLFRELREGIQEVIALDTALVDLQKTSDANAAQLEEFYYSANETAKSLGVTTKEVISSAAAWSRLGYSIKDAQTMASTSSIFASISPEMDIDTATDGLISVMKAFDIEAEDALDSIASKINAIGNTQAVDNQDIVSFLTRASVAMKEANNTLEETIALGTAAVEITRDAEGAGTAMKSFSMRIRGYDEETGAYVGGVEELSGKIADFTKTAETPKGISLFTDEDKTQFKSTTQLLREISAIYDDLTDKDQANLLENIAGKRQAQVVGAILENFDAVESSLETMTTSAGGAMAEMAIIEESLEFKLNALKETATGVFQNIFNREDVSTVIDLLTRLLEIIDKVTEHIGLFGTVAAAGTIGIGIKSIS